MSEAIRVLIADDHAIVRQGLRLFCDLQDDMEVVGEAVNGLDVVEQARVLLPDVVVMDLVMPELDGVRATLGVGECSPRTKVLVLSSFADDDRVRSALRAGAMGYLTKDVDPERVVDGIRAVHRGEPLLPPDVATRISRAVAPDPHQPSGMVTILFTDIVDSTSLVRSLGDVESRPVFREHDRLVRKAIKRYGGYEVRTQGDGFMVAFRTAGDGVLCAVDVQRMITKLDALETPAPVRVRAGLNTGDVVSETDDYFGEAVIVAARVTNIAGGGEILVSDTTRSLAEGCAAFVDRGERELKGCGTHRVFEAVWSS